MREPSREDLFYVEQIAALSTEGASADEIGEALELLSQRVLRLARRFGVKLLPRRGPPSARRSGATKRWFSAPSPLDFDGSRCAAAVR